MLTSRVLPLKNPSRCLSDDSEIDCSTVLGPRPVISQAVRVKDRSFDLLLLAETMGNPRTIKLFRAETARQDSQVTHLCNVKVPAHNFAPHERSLLQHEANRWANIVCKHSSRPELIGHRNSPFRERLARVFDWNKGKYVCLINQLDLCAYLPNRHAFERKELDDWSLTPGNPRVMNPASLLRKRCQHVCGHENESLQRTNCSCRDSLSENIIDSD